MAIDLEAYSRLVGHLYGGPLDGLALDAALVDLASVARVEKATIVDTFPDGRKAISAWAGMGPSAVDAYNAHFHKLDELIPITGAPPVAFTRRTASRHWPGYTGTEFFNDWADRHDNQQIALVTVSLAAGLRSSLVLVASSRDVGFGCVDQVALLRLMAPHLHRMMTIAARITRLERRSKQFLAALERWPYGIVVLDGQGRVLHVNGSALAIVRAKDGIRLTSRGLHAEAREADRRLGALIASALEFRSTKDPRSINTVRVPRPSHARAYLVQAVLMTGRPSSNGDAWSDSGLDEAMVMMIIVDPTREVRPHSDLLRLAFNLTRAEAMVASLTLEGRGLKAVADQLGLSIATVRTHLQHVFEKTGTGRQAELVNVLARLGPGLTLTHAG
jgi:DNA-binding CsgD family transcriptional regulator/PAS domain-containing protein